MKPSRKITMAAATFGLLAATMGTVTVPAQAAASAASATDARQKIFEVIGANMKPLAAAARSGSMSPALVTNAKNLAAHARKVDAAFNTDTRGSSVKTEAKDSIWTNRADFRAKANKFVSASDALVTATSSGDSGKFKSALMAVGQSCKDCHSAYRSE